MNQYKLYNSVCDGHGSTGQFCWNTGISCGAHLSEKQNLKLLCHDVFMSLLFLPHLQKNKLPWNTPDGPMVSVTPLAPLPWNPVFSDTDCDWHRQVRAAESRTEWTGKDVWPEKQLLQKPLKMHGWRIFNLLLSERKLRNYGECWKYFGLILSYLILFY